MIKSYEECASARRVSRGQTWSRPRVAQPMINRGSNSVVVRKNEQIGLNVLHVLAPERDLLPPLGVLHSDHRYNSNQTSPHTSKQT